MAEIRYSLNLFLRYICSIFLCAFTSFYIQIPGLYGENGILPASTQLDITGSDFAAKLQKKPTLLWFAPNLGLDTEHMMDVLALLGMFLSFTGLISQKCCTKPLFASLWSLYYSLYQVGQVFMWFQWDILLLETGFICILLSPWRQKSGSSSSSGKKQSANTSSTTPHDYINFWLVRWLLFRLLFSSGVEKLKSGCPTWWGLTAFNVHFESMVLPTPLAWYLHHLPGWLLKLGVVFTYFVEIFVPPIFFCPIRSARIVAFFIQVFFQLGIIISGNYNFFNYLTIGLCISLLDDDFFGSSGGSKKSRFITRLMKGLGTAYIYGSVIYCVFILFGLKIMPGGVVESKITFNPSDFDLVLGRALILLSSVAVFSLLFTCLNAFTMVFSQAGTTYSKVTSFAATLFYMIVALSLYSDSLVPFVDLHPATGNASIYPEVRKLHNDLSHLHLTNSYGLFRKMTGVGGRPEVIIEGSNDKEGPWVEYHFKYKPGNVNTSLPIVAPHTPRLDWQMWFAALGTYHQNPWFMSLTYRLLTGSKEVLALMDVQKNPFVVQPPVYIRANIYHYSYTPSNAMNKPATWIRKKSGNYQPPFTKSHEPLLELLKNSKIIQTEKKKKGQQSAIFINYLNGVRSAFAVIEPPFLILSLIMTGLAIIIFGSLTSSPTHTQGKQQQQQQQQQQQKSKKKKY